MKSTDRRMCACNLEQNGTVRGNVCIFRGIGTYIQSCKAKNAWNTGSFGSQQLVQSYLYNTYSTVQNTREMLRITIASGPTVVESTLASLSSYEYVGISVCRCTISMKLTACDAWNCSQEACEVPYAGRNGEFDFFFGNWSALENFW